MQLTELQKNCWQSVGHDSAATKKIRNNALQFYLEYREHLKQSHSFIDNQKKIQTLFLISYFISQKSEIVYGLNGQKINNIAFSINQLVKDNTDYKQFFFHLKQMVKKITLPEEAKQCQVEINAFVKYFSFVMTFYNKFLSTFQKITICHNIHERDLQILGGQTQFKNKIKYLLWLLFIYFRKVVFKNNMDTIGNTCLMASIYTYLVTQIYKVQKVTSLYAPDIVQDLGTLSNQFAQVQVQMMNFFCLKDKKTYEKVKNLFVQFIQTLSSKYHQFNGIFSLKNITSNIKRLQQLYRKNIETNFIDQTLFLKNLVSNQQNVRFTAFGAKRKIGRSSCNNNILNCKRVLNYEQETNNNDNLITIDNKSEQTNQRDKGKTKQKNFLDIIQRVKYSQTPIILIQATPISQFSTGYNWLFNKSLKMPQNQQQHKQLDIQSLLQIGYKNDQYQLGNEQILQKKHLIEGIFYQLLDEYDQQSSIAVNVCALLALQVFYYVMNITNRQMNELVQVLNISWYSVWEGLQKLLNYDKNMPNHIKTHLLLLQTTIITTYIWKQQQFIDIVNKQDISQAFPSFFYRILHHLAYQIHFIGKQLNLIDSLIDQIFIVCQFYLKQMSFLMKNMNIDVILMCSIYGVCRAKQIDIMFKSIMAAYKSINNMDWKLYETIQCFKNQNGEQINIIIYYNQVFRKKAKSILLKIKDQILYKDDMIISTNYILSPVKSILPQSFSSKTYVDNTPSYNQMLFAYNQSPLLKKDKRFQIMDENRENKQNLEYKINVNSKQKLYCDRNQILRGRCGNMSQMIQKKFGSGKNSTLIAKGYETKIGLTCVSL